MPGASWLASDLVIRAREEFLCACLQTIKTGVQNTRANMEYDRKKRICRKNNTHKTRSEEHTSELQSLMRISYAVFCLKIQISSYTTLPSTITVTSRVYHSTSSTTLKLNNNQL